MSGGWWLEVAAVTTVVIAAVALVLVVKGNRQIDRACREIFAEREAAQNVRVLDDGAWHVADDYGDWR